MKENVKRPNPDLLLGAILEEESRAKKGRLKIFFGMAAGVGKTYAMLEEAHRLIREGKKVTIGYVETHGRRETDSLVHDIEILPRKKYDHGEFKLNEFDIDMALLLKPEFIVVDELAHTNAEGARHAKRYQDVEELIDNGISVLTTLNIQHLESQSDIVEKITGTPIREKIPDSVLDTADEIELVDLSSEELLKRLRKGKVYIPERAGAAIENFFKISNITALRELSLQYMSRVVDRDLDKHTRRKEIHGTWKSGEKILVAVSSSPYSEYLIRWTRRAAFNTKAQWTALYIENDKNLSDSAKEILHHNLSLARELGADVVTTYNDDIVSGLLHIAQQNNITQIIVGKPLRRYITDFIKGGSLVERLIRRCGDIEIHVVTQPRSLVKNKPFYLGFSPTSPAQSYLGSILVVFGVTGLSEILVSFTGYWTIALLYLLSVSFTAIFVGRGPVLLSALLSATAWNFLFIPPLYTLRIAKLEDALMFGTYFIIALILGGMTSKLRIKEQAIRKREKRISDLYELAKKLDDAHGIDEISAVTVNYFQSYLGMQSALFIADEDGIISDKNTAPGMIRLNEKDKSIVDWVYKNNKSAGLFTKTLPKAGAFFQPMRSPSHIVGVIALKPENPAALTPEIEHFIENIVSQIAIRIESELLSLSKRNALLVSESERLHKVLLNTISHELRTPLTAITGASSGLLDQTIAAHPEVRTELAREIKKASERLNHLVDNLLDMSRLESGILRLNKHFHDINDLISVSVRRLKDESVHHLLHISVDENIPLLYIDFSLMEQALTNIIYNALLYTPKGSTIHIEALYQNSYATIAVKDNGLGLVQEDIPYLFEKFRRGSHVSTGGTGLGLSICRGIVEAHGGTITAMNRTGGGAVFVIEIPTENTEKGE